MAMVFVEHRAAYFVRSGYNRDCFTGVQPLDDPIVVLHKACRVSLAQIGQDAKQMMGPDRNSHAELMAFIFTRPKHSGFDLTQMRSHLGSSAP